MKLALLTIIALAGLQFALAQNVTDCTDIAAGLETIAIDPITVPDLPVCVDQRGGPQCCSTQFILNRLTMTEQDFIDGLRLELMERFMAFDTLVERLRTFLEGDFLTGYLGSFGNFGFLRGARGLINGFANNLRNRIDFVPGGSSSDEEESSMSRSGGANMTDGSGFNAFQFITDVTAALENLAVNELAGGQPGQAAQCIRQVIEGQVEQQRVEVQAAALQEIRRVMASFDVLRQFIANLTNDLAGFRPLQQCVETVVLLNTCGRCEAVRPPFCENVCEAIASACYSPFNDAMTDQLEQLWEVTEGIIEAAVTAIRELNINRGFFNRTEIISQISTVCQIDVSPRVRREDDDDDLEEIPVLPDIINMISATLDGGPFDYMGRQERGSGLCRLLNTSSTNCWDGNQVVTDDVDDFEGDDILSQVNNPVISIPQTDLMQQATLLGTPITTVLNSPSFADVAPTGLTIPQIGGPGVGPGNGAATTFLSLTSLFMMLIFSFFGI